MRGHVTTFSPRSRKRMLDDLARIDEKNAGFIAFVTLTYPDQKGIPSYEDTERDRSSFLKRIMRLSPEASAIWRREYEVRKSGLFKGLIVPHYHMLFFNLPFLPHENLNEMWKGVIKCSGYVRTEIKGLESWRQAFYYASKYLAKPEEEEESRDEASCPAAGTAGQEGEERGAFCSLVYGTYLTGKVEAKEVQERGKPYSTGRHWGKFNAKKLPYAKQNIVVLPDGKWVKSFRLLASSKYYPAGIENGYGFTIYDDKGADYWVDWANKCRAMEQEK